MAIDVMNAVKDWVASPPHVYIKLKDTLEDPGSSFEEFSEIICFDPSLTARLLKIVNSSFYSLETEVETISHALSVVGTEQLMELVLATSVMNQFTHIPKQLVNMDSFWDHSIACGVAAKVVAEWRGESHLESFYLAGMLHDIGSLIIYEKFPEEAKKILKRCKENHENLFDVEQEILEASHADVGGHLLQGWGLPKSLYEPVFFHHRPEKAKDFSLVTRIIQVADSIVDELELGTSGEVAANPVKPEDLQELGFNELPVEQFEQAIRDQFCDVVVVLA